MKDWLYLLYFFFFYLQFVFTKTKCDLCIICFNITTLDCKTWKEYSLLNVDIISCIINYFIIFFINPNVDLLFRDKIKCQEEPHYSSNYKKRMTEKNSISCSINIYN